MATLASVAERALAMLSEKPSRDHVWSDCLVLAYSRTPNVGQVGAMGYFCEADMEDAAKFEASVLCPLVEHLRSEMYGKRILDLAWEERLPRNIPSAVARSDMGSLRVVVDHMTTHDAPHRIPDEWLTIAENHYNVGTDVTQKQFVCAVIRLDVGVEGYAGPLAVHRPLEAA